MTITGLSSIEGVSFLSMRYSGEKLLTRTNRITRNYLESVNPDGVSDRNRIIDQTSFAESSGTYSGNGRYVAFTQAVVASKEQIYIRDLVSGRITTITSNTANQYEYPVWDPQDSTVIYFVENPSTINAKLCSVPVGGGSINYIRTFANGLYTNAISPDGSIFVFRTGGGSGNRIIRLPMNDLANAAFTELVNVSVVCTDPKFNYDGTKILYSQQVSSVYQIHQMNIDGTSKQAITTGIGNKRFPIQSKVAPYYIYYTFNNSGDDEIWKMNVDFTGNAPVIDTTGNDILYDVFTPEPMRPLVVADIKLDSLTGVSDILRWSDSYLAGGYFIEIDSSIATLPIPLPSKVPNVRVTSFIGSTAILEWSPAYNATSYKVYVSGDGGLTYLETFNAISTSDITITLNGLPTGQDLYFYVRAVNGAGESDSTEFVFQYQRFRLMYRLNEGLRYYIYTNNETFTNPRRVTNQTSFSEGEASISFDNSKLAITRNIYNTGFNQIFLINPFTKEEYQLTDSGAVNYKYPVLNDDATLIFYTKGGTDIFRNTTSATPANFNSTEVRLTSLSSTDRIGINNIMYDSIRDQLVFTSINSIAIIPASGAGNVLTSKFFIVPEAHRHPALNKSRDKVAMCHYNPVSPYYFQLATCSPTGTSKVIHTSYSQTINSPNSTTGGDASFRPLWNLTGDYIYYYLHSYTPSNQRVMRINSDGTGVTEIINGSQFSFNSSLIFLDSGIINVF